MIVVSMAGLGSRLEFRQPEPPSPKLKKAATPAARLLDRERKAARIKRYRLNLADDPTRLADLRERKNERNRQRRARKKAAKERDA